MDKEDVMALLVLVAFLAVIVAAAMVSSVHTARDRFEKEAVQAGAARWVFDEAGESRFEWRKP